MGMNNTDPIKNNIDPKREHLDRIVEVVVAVVDAIVGMTVDKETLSSSFLLSPVDLNACCRSLSIFVAILSIVNEEFENDPLLDALRDKLFETDRVTLSDTVEVLGGSGLSAIADRGSFLLDIAK
jgi:hypothetical protein